MRSSSTSGGEGGTSSLSSSSGARRLIDVDASGRLRPSVGGEALSPGRSSSSSVCRTLPSVENKNDVRNSEEEKSYDAGSEMPSSCAHGAYQLPAISYAATVTVTAAAPGADESASSIGPAFSSSQVLVGSDDADPPGTPPAVPLPPILLPEAPVVCPMPEGSALSSRQASSPTPNSHASLGEVRREEGKDGQEMYMQGAGDNIFVQQQS